MYTAGSLNIHDALILLVGLVMDNNNTQDKRATTMTEACKAIDGGMSAVMFCPFPTLQTVLTEIQKEGGFCEISNINSPKQVTVSGTKEKSKSHSIERQLSISLFNHGICGGRIPTVHS